MPIEIGHTLTPFGGVIHKLVRLEKLFKEWGSECGSVFLESQRKGSEEVRHLGFAVVKPQVFALSTIERLKVQANLCIIKPGVCTGEAFFVLREEPGVLGAFSFVVNEQKRALWEGSLEERINQLGGPGVLVVEVVRFSESVHNHEFWAELGVNPRKVGAFFLRDVRDGEWWKKVPPDVLRWTHLLETSGAAKLRRIKFEKIAIRLACG